MLVSREQMARALRERSVVAFLVVGAALVWVHARSGRNETASLNT